LFQLGQEVLVIICLMLVGVHFSHICVMLHNIIVNILAIVILNI
jgi:hypothetical protein